MNNQNKPSAELFVATGCTHCPLVLTELGEQLKKGQLSSLNVTNIAVNTDKAEKLNIRSVPWFSLEHDKSFMIFSGKHSAKEIQNWVATSQNQNGMQEYIEEYLTNGQLMSVVHAIQLKPEIFSIIISMLEDEETSMNIRIGLDALIENFSSTEILQKYTDDLKNIASKNNTRLQIDALHYIALTGDIKNKEFLKEKTEDNNSQIKEAAVEALETLQELTE